MKRLFATINRLWQFYRGSFQRKKGKDGDRDLFGDNPYIIF